MIKNYARPTGVVIPEHLQKYVLNTFHGGSEGPVTVSYPMFATGFPLLLHAAYGLPSIGNDKGKNPVENRLNIAGQIYDVDITLSYDDSIIEATGVILHPMALYYLFGIEGKSVINSWVAVKNLYPEQHMVFKALDKIKNVDLRIKLLLDFVSDLEKARREPIDFIDEALNLILKSNGNIEINEIVETIDVSERHFRRVFKKLIGMPPKHFCKVLQINTIFSLMETNDDCLLNLALDCGYFDQSHFLSDFKKYIGDTPNNFLNSEHAFIKSYLALR